MIATENKKLHLGCFDLPADGWVNTDISPHIWISRIPLAAVGLRSLGKMTPERFAQHKQGVFRKVNYLDVSRAFPYRSESFNAIFTCHMLEHLYPAVATKCLRECHRVLCPGGVLRIVIPDLDKIAQDYDHNDPAHFLDSIFQNEKGMGKNSHHWHYNYKSLRSLLLEIGFSRVERCDFQVGVCPDINELDQRPESLFAEAFKEP